MGGTDITHIVHMQECTHSRSCMCITANLACRMSSTDAAVAALQREWAMPRINFSRDAAKVVAKLSPGSSSGADAGAAEEP